MSAFRFFDPGPLVDRDLELVAPSERWIDPVLLACRHPLSAADERCKATTRQTLLDFLKIAPGGNQPANERNRAPAYHFWMRLLPQYEPPVPIAGGLNLRIGDSFELRTYFGNIGYAVYPPARGRHLAERACRLLFPIARRHGMRELWITTNPENVASRRTCERLGGVFVDVVDVPRDNVLYERGEKRKCRYRMPI